MVARERLVVVTAIPDELRNTLTPNYELVPLADADPGEPFRIAVTTSMGGFSAELMEQLPHLGMIACNGVGMDRIDLGAAEQRGIVVRNTPGVLTEDVADAAIGLMFAAARRIVEADRFVRAGRWGPEKMPTSRRLTGATVGIVGMGQIGQAIARRAAGIGMTVLYTSPRSKPELAWRHLTTPRDLAAEVDVLVLACPGGPANTNLIDADVLAALGPGGFLVNVSRGEVVDEEALISALRSGTLAGAALDVFKQEPGLDPRFLDLDNVVLQPHYASVTAETRRDIAAMLDRAIAAFLAKGDNSDGAPSG